MSKKSSPIPTLEFEKKAGYPGRFVIGVDEVGRGCLAGPVMAGAFALPLVNSVEMPEWLCQVRDSKLLTPRAREDLYSKLSSWTSLWSVAEASVAEIDEKNILRAVELAMKRAVDAVLAKLESDIQTELNGKIVILVDGNRVPPCFRGRAQAIVGGDRVSLSIACASILAKVTRDRRLEELDQRYPGYGLAIHKGYGTAKHLESLSRLKPCPEHRRSFAPVQLALQTISN